MVFLELHGTAGDVGDQDGITAATERTADPTGAEHGVANADALRRRAGEGALADQGARLTGRGRGKGTDLSAPGGVRERSAGEHGKLANSSDVILNERSRCMVPPN